ncbi:MAG: cell division protein FtsZ [Acetobacteraceae bacterium]|nr:cell division protein FtsZ [Acetobacteraceae bacterium]
MTLNLTIPQHTHTDFRPRITVIGVGGGGTNAVDNMIAMNLQGVEFIVANTDAQQLMHSRADCRIQLGLHLTLGLGAGAKPEIGQAAAEEAAEELMRHLDGVNMIFITAGMGGGTGTGAAPVIARLARERDILTVGVVTKPFAFEGQKRARAAEAGIAELTKFVDTLIVIPNQNLFLMANERTGWREAFKMADNVLYKGVRGVTDLMVAPGLVNLDFADIRTVMAEMGTAMMGTGEAEGEGRALRAAEQAIQNPLLEQASMAGAKGLLINITGGEDLALFEVDDAATRIGKEVHPDANIIFGSAIDESLAGRVVVSVVATGIESATSHPRNEERPRLVAVGGGAVYAVSGSSIDGPAANGPSASPLSLVPEIPLTTRPQPQPATGWAMPPRVAPSEMSPQAPPASLPVQRVAPLPPRPEPTPAVLRAPQPEARSAPPIDDTPLPPRHIQKRHQQPVTVQPKGEAPPRRQSLFSIVTQAFKPVPPVAEPAAVVVAAPAPHPAPMAQPYLEPVQAAGTADSDLEIPTFLRRQGLPAKV